jgi:hypothetical protein
MSEHRCWYGYVSFRRNSLLNGGGNVRLFTLASAYPVHIIYERLVFEKDGRTSVSSTLEAPSVSRAWKRSSRCFASVGLCVHVPLALNKAMEKQSWSVGVSGAP